jgi:hypothetical protein
MVDAFPTIPADPDYQMQLQIAAELQNAQAVQAEFERSYPKDPSSRVATLATRLGHYPTGASLYPALTAAADRQAWVMPLLRRLAWHHLQGESGAAWQSTLADMLRIALERLRRVSEAEFVALADELERRPHGYRQALGIFARELEKDGPLSPSVADALARLRRLADRTHEVGLAESIAWPFFRSPIAADDPDPCWSARVRRDLGSLAPQLRADWHEALITGLSQYRDYSGAPGKSCAAALKRLGNVEMEARLRRWIGMLSEGPRLALTLTGAMIFDKVVELCHLLGGPVSDQLLYDIARAPWTEAPEYRWIHTYLWALGSRSQDRAFACLEALMMNPVTAVAYVQRQYEGLLAVFGAREIPNSSVGVDGFPLNSDPALVPQQTRIDQLLRMAASAAAGGRYVDSRVAAMVERYRAMKEEDLPPAVRATMKTWVDQMTRKLPWFPVAPEVKAAYQAMQEAILKEFGADPDSLYRAVAARSEWIAAHKQEYAKDTLELWEQWLYGLGCGEGLVPRSFAKVDQLSLEELVRALKAGGVGLRVSELCGKYVAEHGWHPDLVEAFRQWIPSIGVAASDRIYRARAEWFLWFENVAPIDLEACWSHRVKRDLREMPPDQYANWRALLDNSAFTVTAKPPAKWLKAAEKAFPKVGVAAFRRRFVKWFEPFAKGETLRMTVPGRNILRVLMWYALVSKDSAVDEALLGFANARWKTKEVARCAAQAEMAFSYVLSQRMPEAALPLLEAFVESGQAYDGSATHQVYKALCARWKHPPVSALPKPASPEKAPAGLPPFNSEALLEGFRRLAQIPAPPRPSK